MPRSLWPSSKRQTTPGRLPMPICSVAPSGISSTTLRATSGSSSFGGGDRKLFERRVVFDDRGHLRHVNLAGPRTARHVPVDLDDDPRGASCTGRRNSRCWCRG